MSRAEPAHGVVTLRLWNGIRNHFRVRADVERGRFLALLFARVVYEGGVLEDAAFDQPEGKPFEPRPAVFHSPPVQSPERPHHIRDLPAMRPVSRGEGGVRKKRMNVHDLII